MKEKIAHERLLAVVEYDPATGVFTNRITRGRAKAGAESGSISKSTGYRLISIDGRNYSAQSLAWFYMTGKWAHQVDHKNRLRADNAFVNLREATSAQNAINSTIFKSNTTGFKGVTKWSDRKGFRANITVNAKTVYLGTYSRKRKAHAAYVQAAQTYFGEFAPIAA